METNADNSGHGEHLPVVYEPAVPVSPGKLAMWLFLSTEIMFFTALIGSYIVLRFGVPEGDWPSPQTMMTLKWVGALNTLVLICSGVTMFLVLQNANRDNPAKAKQWLLLTILLGSSFLGIKAYEYWTKFSHGIYPRVPRSLIYDRPDINYLAGLKAKLKSDIYELESPLQGKQFEGGAQRLETLYLLQLGMVGWTEQKVGATDDPNMRRHAIDSLAHQIFPIEELNNSARIENYLANESTEVRQLYEQKAPKLKAVEEQLRSTQSELASLATVSRPDEATQARIKEQTTSASALTAQVSQLKKQVIPLAKRMEALEEFKNINGGINEYYDLKLPIVIPNGNTWVNTYFLLTGFHALHLLAGIVVLLILFTIRLGRSRSGLVENVGLYWHFVDIVWLVLFPLLYLS